MKKSIIFIFSLILITILSSCHFLGHNEKQLKLNNNIEKTKIETKSNIINEPLIIREVAKKEVEINNNKNDSKQTTFILTHDGNFLQDICIKNHGNRENTKALIEKMKDDILDDEMSLMPYEATKVDIKFVDSCLEKYDVYCEIQEKSLSFGLEFDSKSSENTDANIEVKDSGFAYKAHFAPVGYNSKEGKGVIMLSCAAGGGKLYGPDGEIKTESDWK